METCEKNQLYIVLGTFFAGLIVGLVIIPLIAMLKKKATTTTAWEIQAAVWNTFHLSSTTLKRRTFRDSLFTTVIECFQDLTTDYIWL